MSVKWDLGKFLGEVEAELYRRFTKAGVFFVSKLRGYLNRSQPYTRSQGGKKYHGRDPSKPGEFPKKLTGQLQRSLTWEVDKKNMVLTVGSNLDGYPKYLQTGTKFMQPRPWLTLGFGLEKDQMGRIITGE